MSLMLLTHGAAGSIEPQPLLEGLAFPTNMAVLPDGGLVFTEKETGSVRIVTPDGELRGRPLTTVAVSPGAERGLLGIAVHPEFERQ
ncbi:MAG TPA: PQQ-dependent sugar dehydrogenase, partial [Actinomycetota bacterium]|nr:PQQ-dependent sugar dehydrogenase [Actinomycetota bacterium]